MLWSPCYIDSTLLLVFFSFSLINSQLREYPKFKNTDWHSALTKLAEVARCGFLINTSINTLIDVIYKNPITNQLYYSVCFLPVTFSFTFVLCYLQRFINLTLTTDLCEKSLLVCHYKGAFSCYPQKDIMKEFSQSEQNILFFPSALQSWWKSCVITLYNVTSHTQVKNSWAAPIRNFGK